MMLADVGIAVVMELVTNDASCKFLQVGHGDLYSLQPAHNDESDSLVEGQSDVGRGLLISNLSRSSVMQPAHRIT